MEIRPFWVCDIFFFLRIQLDLIKRVWEIEWILKEHFMWWMLGWDEDPSFNSERARAQYLVICLPFVVSQLGKWKGGRILKEYLSCAYFRRQRFSSLFIYLYNYFFSFK